MLFDKICKIAEREFPELEKELRQTRLFHFPGNPHQFLPTEIDEEIVKFLKEQFMLPFPSVVIEDNAGMVLIKDVKKNIKGIDQPRQFIDVVRMATPPEAFRDQENESIKSKVAELQQDRIIDYDPVVITSGMIDAVHWVSGKEFFAECTLSGVMTAFINLRGKKKHIQSIHSGLTLKTDLHPDKLDLCLKSAAMNAMTALQEILYANAPSKFILEISPIKKSKGKKSKKSDKIPRSDNRQKYILLKPREIRKLMKENLPRKGDKRKSPIVHERRAHPRTFHSDIFKKMKGKTIMIPAKWIGVSNKVIGNKRYKVMLDM